jgi:hypothetical protein
MRPITFATVAVSLALLAGCVAVPMGRTYYEPNSADGVPIRSSSCGWHATARDALERDIGGVALSVFPSYEEGQPLRIYVLLGKTSKSVDANYNMIEVKSGDGILSARPVTIEAKSAGPYFFASANYVFPLTFNVEDISLVFLPGFITLDGKDVHVAPFRFRRITKWDFYYNSINC